VTALFHQLKQGGKTHLTKHKNFKIENLSEKSEAKPD
jgi:hypothetical protein